MVAAIDFRFLADVDATLNAIATVFIVSGLVAVKRGNIELHKKLMYAATGASTLFLCCYVVYHLTCEPVKFRGEGAAKTAYLALIYLGVKDRREQHKKWAKVTAPIWLYVSITGVAVYWLLYHW